MKYATWKLNFADPNYGTGPEEEIIAQGFTAEGGLISGEAKGGTIMGYFTGDPVNLESWEFTEITQQEALDFALAIDSSAYLVEDGKIGFPTEEIEP